MPRLAIALAVLLKLLLSVVLMMLNKLVVKAPALCEIAPAAVKLTLPLDVTFAPNAVVVPELSEMLPEPDEIACVDAMPFAVLMLMLPSLVEMPCICPESPIVSTPPAPSVKLKLLPNPVRLAPSVLTLLLLVRITLPVAPISNVGVLMMVAPDCVIFPVT